MAFLKKSTYTKKDRLQCVYCSQRYPSKRDLSIHEYIHGNDVRETIFNLTIQPRNNYLVYEEFIYSCGKIASGVFGKEVGCAETPEQEEIDEKSSSKEEFDTSAGQPCHTTPLRDIAYGHKFRTDLFAYKTFHGGITVEPTDDSASVLDSKTENILVKYETFPRRTNMKPRGKWADRYRNSLVSRTDIEGNFPTAFSGAKRCGSTLGLEPGFTLDSGSREINI